LKRWGFAQINQKIARFLTFFSPATPLQFHATSARFFGAASGARSLAGSARRWCFMSGRAGAKVACRAVERPKPNP
jgi:hypothetical protein